MGQTGPRQEDRGWVDQDRSGQGTKKRSSEGSGLIYVLCPGEWDGMGRWVQCWRGHWKIGLGQDSRWGRQGGGPDSQGTDAGSSEQPAWRCHRRSQPAQVTCVRPSWKQAGVGDSRGRDLAGRAVSHQGSQGIQCRIRPMFMKALGKGLKALSPSWVSGGAHSDTQALLAPSGAHCPARLALNVAGPVPLQGTALGARCWAIAQPSSPGNPCW